MNQIVQKTPASTQYNTQYTPVVEGQLDAVFTPTIGDPTVSMLRGFPKYEGAGVGPVSIPWGQQNFQLTPYLFNGKAVWQGVADTETWLVYAKPAQMSSLRADVEVAGVSTRFSFMLPGLGRELTIEGVPVPVVQGTTRQPWGWKMTRSVDFASISNDNLPDDLFRGAPYAMAGGDSLLGEPHYEYGFIIGGDLPVPGVYFRDAEPVFTPVSAGQYAVHMDILGPRISLRTSPLCATAGYPTAQPLIVNSIIDILDVLAAADTACIDIGKTSSTFVVDLLLNTEGNTPPLQADFYVEGHSCCE